MHRKRANHACEPSRRKRLQKSVRAVPREGAAQNRVVQLMFTVPRERLRVVNADDDEDARSIRSGTADGSTDGNGF